MWRGKLLINSGNEEGFNWVQAGNMLSLGVRSLSETVCGRRLSAAFPLQRKQAHIIEDAARPRVGS